MLDFQLKAEERKAWKLGNAAARLIALRERLDLPG
jgi:hypothetical protein